MYFQNVVDVCNTNFPAIFLFSILGNWGPHLIIVPTSVMLNWEMELKRWCPGFKILTYYGSQKERKLKRQVLNAVISHIGNSFYFSSSFFMILKCFPNFQGWTKPNAFHVCITSYKLVLQDHQAFRRKSWRYLILDEAQNIKNFKSQRWQSLLNFNRYLEIKLFLKLFFNLHLMCITQVMHTL